MKRRNEQPADHGSESEVQDLPVNLQCQRLECQETVTCPISQLSSVIFTETLVYLSGQPDSGITCGEDCQDEAKRAVYPVSPQTDYLKSLVSTEMSIDFSL